MRDKPMEERCERCLYWDALVPRHRAFGARCLQTTRNVAQYVGVVFTGYAEGFSVTDKNDSCEHFTPTEARTDDE